MRPEQEQRGLFHASGDADPNSACSPRPANRRLKNINNHTGYIRLHPIACLALPLASSSRHQPPSAFAHIRNFVPIV
jgi:hypothetical protein